MARQCIVVRRPTALFVCLLAASVFLCFFHRASALMVGSARSGPPEVPFRPGSVVAIDLGNTNSCVAGYRDGHAETMFQHCIPSWVAFADDGAVLVGEAAKNHAAFNPEAAIFGFKRLLGKRFDHEDVQRVAEHVPYRIVNRDTRTRIQVGLKTTGDGGVAKLLDVEEAAAVVFAELKANAEAYLGRKVHNAVVTVPQYFGDASRRAAMDAATIAGLTTVRIIDEPTAAAVSYGLHRKLRNEGNVLVLHLGGGTSDATILTYEDDVFDVLGSCHDIHLGGEDFDQRIMDHFIQLIQKKHGMDISNDKIALGKLGTGCEHAKKALSNQDVAHVNVESLLDGADFSEPLTRAKFEELNHDLFLKVMALVEKAMMGSELADRKDWIDEIVLVGGSTGIPRIQELVKNYFDENQLNTRPEPDAAAVHGAALLGHPAAGGYQCMGGGDRRQLGASTDWCYHY